MPRRNVDSHRDVTFANVISEFTASPCYDLKHGELLKDLVGKEWRLGKTVGTGGFGEIFLAGENIFKEVNANTPYVAKVESHSNGPLFVEINCYLRIAKPDLVESWKNEKKLSTLGMPHYVASGSHINGSNKYRFLIIPRFEKDLEQVFKEKRKFNIKTVLTITCQILDVLEYIHSKGYVHSDIKASNILLGNSQQIKRTLFSPRITRLTKYPALKPVRTCRAKKMSRASRNLRPVPFVNYIDDIPFIDDILETKITEAPKKNPEKPIDQVYLVDFGLAAKYVGSDGQHKEFCRDERKAHAGTVLFCSRDAHTGVISRRSDLESLAYNMVYWLTGTLPWYEDVLQPEVVAKTKQRCFGNLGVFLQSAFVDGCPKFVHEYFSYLSNLQFDSEPDYTFCKNIFINALREYGYKNDHRLDFDNLEGWGRKQKKFKHNSENKRSTRATLFIGPHRLPLHSNNVSLIRPLLRKKVKSKNMHSMMNWSKILVQDPEVILKQANKGRDRKNTEGSDTCNVLQLDIDQMNPTYAMLDVVARCRERGGVSPTDRGDNNTSSIQGYTPAMMAVYTRMKEREEFEFIHNMPVIKKRSRSTKRQAVKRKCSESPTIKKSTKLRACKSSNPDFQVLRREGSQTRKAKVVPMKRIYSLRG